jgi:TonB C terminal
VSTTPPPSPELLRLKKQAVKRFHPDNAVDREDEIRLTRLMQAANAAFDARDEAALRAVFAPPQAPPPQAPPPQAPPNAWGPRTYETPPRAAQSQQQPPPVRNVRTFKSWFWLSWLPWGVLWIATDLNPSWDKAGVPVVFFLLGLIVSFFVAANRTKLWSTGRWKPHVRVGAITAVAAIAFVFLCWVIETATPRKDASPSLAQSITKQGAASAPGSTEETDYTNGIIREIDRNFVFFADKGHSNPQKGAVVDMSFQIGPTGYHNAASIVKSSGDSGFDWACTQAVEKSANFGNLPANTKGGNIIVSYRCAFNAPDTITKVVVVPAESDTQKVTVGPTREPLSTSVKQSRSDKWVGGVYKGTVHNNSGLDANITATFERQLNVALGGYFSVDYPLSGSGPLRGAIVGNGLQFTVSPKDYSYELTFRGRFTEAALIRGTYTVANGQSGTFIMRRLSPSSSHKKTHTSYVGNRRGEVVVLYQYSKG